MKLISLEANHSSFHKIYFKDGVNIIIGKQVGPRNKNDGNTYNGVGKSLILHLIHFCLGSNKIESLSRKLQGWEFSLKFEINGEKYCSSRNTDNQNEISFSGETLKVSQLREKLLNLCFDNDVNYKSMTWNTLFSRFVRRYRMCYSQFDTFVPNEQAYSKILNNCYLLGMDIDLIVNKKELRDRQATISETEKVITKDPLFKQYYLGKNDAELDVADLEYRITELSKEISEFKISKNYHELEKEANDKSYTKKILENKRFIINNNIKNIEESLRENSQVNEDNLINVYEAAKVEIPEMIKKSINEVIYFHKELLLTRKLRLRKELNKQKNELKAVDEEILLLGQQMDTMLEFLNSHGALEEYLSLTKQLSSLQSELNRVYEYKKILKTYRDNKHDIKVDLAYQDKEADIYLETEKVYLSEISDKYRSYAKYFYPKKKSGLIIENNFGENMIRYTLDARIEDDSSDGVNEVRMFCFDLLLLVCKKSKIRFIAHDSRLFANMDPRQRASLFKLVSETCKREKLQYICSINEDALLSFKDLLSDNEYADIIGENIILTLNDDSPESKLLGIQIDIDLEDKHKSVSAMT